MSLRCVQHGVTKKMASAGGGIATPLPLQVAGCTAWYDLQDYATITLASGSHITQLKDKSVSANHAVTHPVYTGGNPVYSTTAIGTYPGMLMNFGALHVSNNLAHLPATVFVVFNRTANDSHTVVLGNDTYYGSTQDYGYIGVCQLYVLCDDHITSTGRIQYSSPPITTNIPAILTARLDTVASNNQFFIGATNLTPLTTNTGVSNANLTTVRNLGVVNNGSSAVRGFSGNLGEIIVYNSLLSGSDQSKVYNYLKTKWGTP